MIIRIFCKITFLPVVRRDAGLYKLRYIIERFFRSVIDMRRLVTRFEILSRNFLATIHIFAIRLRINRVHTPVVNYQH